ncbi:ATP-binding cassette domain-containing protein [Thermovibrio ammonificans]
MNVVEARELYITYRKGRVVAVNGLSFAVPKGAVFIFIGPDGAGKSSTLKAVAGVLTYNGGSLRTFGVDPNNDRAFSRIRERLSFMPQGLGHNLYKRLSVLENLRLFAELYGLSKKEREERIELLLKVTGLEPFKGRLAGHLSGGMMQKLSLACVLLHRPELLILDEPTTGVDPISRREIWRLLYRYNRDGMTILLSTSYLDEAERGTALLLMNRGEAVVSGEPERVVKTRYPVFEARGPDVEKAYSVVWSFSNNPRLKRGRLRFTAPKERVEEGLRGLNVELREVEPTLEDLFVEKVGLKRVEIPDDFKPSAEIPEEAVVVDSVVKKFGSFTAVKGVSFTVKRGEIFGLLGPNGAGKTTLIKTILGLYRPNAGRIVVAGSSEPSKIKRLVGYTSQKFSLYSDLTVFENLVYWGNAYGLAPKVVKALVEKTASYFGLDNYLGELVENLPLGVKQRVSLLSALLHSPSVLFLDEPTSGVDPAERDAFWQAIRLLSRRFGVTAIVTTHYMDEAEYCDRVALMSRGELVALGSPEELEQEVERELGKPFLLSCKDPFEAEERLVAAGYRATLYGRKVKFFSAEEITPEKIRSLGIEPYSLKPSAVTMEDVFVFKAGR